MTRLLGTSIFVGAAIFVGIGYQLFGGSLEEMRATTDYTTLLLVNGLVGISAALFVIELKWDALRVVLTVVVALLIGYLVTVAFSLDSANRFAQGEFRVLLLSENDPVESETVDLVYGQQRGGTFDPDLRSAAYTFEGRTGDTITAVGFAANRRSEVDMQIALTAPDGDVLAESTSIPAGQLEQFEDVRRESDALIAEITLPQDGVYTITAEPEPLQFGTILSEASQAANTAYDAFLLGALSRPNRWALWIQDALTLILVGLAVAVVFRAEQFSLGAEGQLYFGALASGALVVQMGNLPGWLVIPTALAAAITAGFLWGLIPGALKAYLGANELVSTLMLNAIAVRFYEMVLIYRLKPPDSTIISSATFPESGVLPPILEGTQVTTAVFIVIVAVILSWVFIRRTPLGYEIRMIGANIRFAEYGGVRTARDVMLVMAISGGIAGLAGAHLGMGIHQRLIVNISFGLAFEGVVVALLARNNVLVVPMAGLLYAYLRAGAQFMERDANISLEVVRIIQAIIILLITAEAIVAYLRSRRQRQQTATQIDTPPMKPSETASV